MQVYYCLDPQLGQYLSFPLRRFPQWTQNVSGMEGLLEELISAAFPKKALISGLVK